MHTNQFIESIVRAVKGAESSPEFCLRFFEQSWWSCMTKAEWSGWMQAIFSVVAIFFALLAALIVPYWQARGEKKRALQLADQVALRVRSRIKLFTLNSAPVIALFETMNTRSFTDDERAFLISYIQTEFASEEQLTRLIIAGDFISHNLSQACSIFEQCAFLLKLGSGAEMTKDQNEMAAQNLNNHISLAFETLAAANTGIDKYLKKRKFKVVAQRGQVEPA